MERAMTMFSLPQRYQRTFLIALVVVFGILIPSVVVADVVTGFDTEKLIGMTGVSDSQLLIGRDSGGYGLFHIAMGGSHFHENDPAYRIVSLAPLLYVAMLVWVLLGLCTHMDLKMIIVGVVAIYLAQGLLVGMQTTITDLLR